MIGNVLCLGTVAYPGWSEGTPINFQSDHDLKSMYFSQAVISSLYSKGRTIRHLGGGGRVFVACKLFFTSERKQSFFLALNVRQFFFYVSSKNFSVVCFPYYVRYHLVFFLVDIFLINFDNKLFFLPIISTNFFFFYFCGDILFFLFFLAHPPQLSNGASL